MKAFLIIVAILTLLLCLGWMSFVTGDGSASLTIDTNKVKEDTSTAVEKGKVIVEEGIEKLKGTTQEEKDAPAPVPSDADLENENTTSTQQL